MEKATQRIKKVAIIGPESTGKSDLCELLAQHYRTVFVPEYARQYFERHDISKYELSDLVLIAKEQLALEKSMLSKAQGFLFYDTTLITIKIWAQHRFKTVPKIISESIKADDYDYYLLSNNDVEWVKDPQRFDEDIRDYLFELNKQELEVLGVRYDIIKGVGEERLHSTIKLIDDFFGFSK
ncbi:MAG: ATP-binding protein [Bacteroidia bacterium]|nr:ATP-binding protein [Bacteroidia bacterium]